MQIQASLYIIIEVRCTHPLRHTWGSGRGVANTNRLLRTFSRSPRVKAKLLQLILFEKRKKKPVANIWHVLNLGDWPRIKKGV